MKRGHHSRPALSFVAPLLLCILLLTMLSEAMAEIATDGTLGPKGSVQGPMYQIPDTLGQTRGNNLFHSFDKFNIGIDETASFTGPANILNVISRVTGGSSSIDGTLQCTISGANFYLINPSGVMFGPNARLDVSGSFYVTTADYLKFSNGDVFYADKNNANSVLSVAEPQAFGFLSSNLAPAPISLDGSVLKVQDGQTLSIIGGDISIANDPTAATYDPYAPLSTYYSLSALGGRINLVSVGLTGEVNLSAPDVSSFTKLGNITLSNGANLNVSGSDGTTPAGSVVIRGGQILFQDSGIDATGNPGGAVDIKGESLQLSNSPLNLFATGDADHSGTACQIDLSGDFVMKNDSWIDSSSYGTGRGGNVRIDAGNVSLGDDTPGSGPLAAFGMYGYIQSGNWFSSGPGGDISIVSAGGVMIMKNGFYIGAATGGQGNAGNIAISAGNDFVMKNESYIDSSSWWTGYGGNIRISAKNITLGDDAPGAPLLETYDYTNPYGCIRSWSNGPGPGGDISIAAGSLVIRNGFYVGTAALDQAGAGKVTVRADTVRLLDQGNIFSDAFTSGAGGLVDVSARDILISAAHATAVTNSQYVTGIGAQTGGAANGGKVIVSTDSLQLLDGGQISTILLGFSQGSDVEVSAKNIQISGFVLDPALTPPYALSGIDARVVGTATTGGIGGNIAVAADNLAVSNGGVIRTSLFDDATGKAGSITVIGGTVKITSGGRIYADSSLGSGDSGDVTIKASSMSISGFGSSQSSYPVSDFTGLSTTTNAGRGGTINVTLTGDLSVTERGGIKADTQGSGLGGDINISAQKVLSTGKSSINSSSAGSGDAGNITLIAADSVIMNQSSITTEAKEADGGNIQIYTPYMLKMNDSKITASVGGGAQTTGGNIAIDPQFVTLNDSQIVANAYEGKGGNISIVSGVFLASPESIVSASSALGVDGTVDIQAPVTEISGGLTPVQAGFLQDTTVFRDQCRARLAGERASSLTMGGREGLPARPGNFLPSPLY